jgi:hypothetical protein
VLSRVRGKRLQLHPRRLGSEALRFLQRWGLDGALMMSDVMRMFKIEKVGMEYGWVLGGSGV